MTVTHITVQTNAFNWSMNMGKFKLVSLNKFYKHFFLLLKTKKSYFILSLVWWWQLSGRWQIDIPLPRHLVRCWSLWDTSVCLYENVPIHRIAGVVHRVWRTHVPRKMPGKLIHSIIILIILNIFRFKLNVCVWASCEDVIHVKWMYLLLWLFHRVNRVIGEI